MPSGAVALLRAFGASSRGFSGHHDSHPYLKVEKSRSPAAQQNQTGQQPTTHS